MVIAILESDACMLLLKRRCIVTEGTMSRSVVTAPSGRLGITTELGTILLPKSFPTPRV